MRMEERPFEDVAPIKTANIKGPLVTAHIARHFALQGYHVVSST